MTRFTREDEKFVYGEEWIVDQFGSGWSEEEKWAKEDITKWDVDENGELNIWIKPKQNEAEIKLYEEFEKLMNEL